MPRYLVAAAFGIALGTAAQAADITVETARGPVELASVPATTAVYDIGALDTLDALGVTGLHGPNTIQIDALKDYESDIGTLFEPDFEALNARAPDLAVTGGRTAKAFDALQKMVPAIDMSIANDTDLEQARARVTAYGALYGKEDAAAALLATLDEELEQTRAAVAGKGRALVLMTNGTKISAYGANGRFAWLYGALGLTEAVEDMKDSNHGEAVSFEFIRDVNPDWILVLDRVAAIGRTGRAPPPRWTTRWSPRPPPPRTARSCI